MISLNVTTHLHDATMVKAYNDNPQTIRLLIDKLTGDSDFHGRTGKWQAQL